MLIFGRNVNIYITSGIIVGGLGFSYIFYTFFKRRQDDEVITEAEGQEDLDLPLELAHDYGNYRLMCQEADSYASDYLLQIPEDFFNFNQNLSLFAFEHLNNRFTKFKNALVIGSGTGKFCIELSKTFSEVKGVERSFTKVVICYRLQNRTHTSYHFPLEGSYRTVKKLLNIGEPLAPQKSSEHISPRKRVAFLENIQFFSSEPNRELAQLGRFQFVALPNSLNNLDDPEGLLSRLSSFVDENGLLIIASDYNWKRTTNQADSFGEVPVDDSFAYLKHILQDHFDFVDDTYIPDVIGESLRSCRIRNCHVTVWVRNTVPSVVHYTYELK